MKTISLFVILLISSIQSYSQACNFTYVQTNNKDTFTLPIMNPIYSIDSVKWEFGDGLDTIEYANSISTNMPHQYLFSGTYIVCLSIWLSEVGNPIPIMCTSCNTIDILCQVNFIADTSGNTITANELNSILPGPITSYSWDYGDSTIHDTTSSIYHAYDTVGNYNLCLTIQGMTPLGNPYQCSACSTIQITKSCHIKSSFDIDIWGGNYIDIVVTAQSSNDCFTRLDSFSYGDGTYAIGSPFFGDEHKYAQYGTYNLCLYSTGYVTGGSIVRDSFCVTITLVENCGVVANFDYSLKSGLSYEFANHTGRSSICSSPYMDSLNFGDGNYTFLYSSTNSLQYTAIHTYTNPGTYMVSMVAKAHKIGQQVSDTTYRFIDVEPCKLSAQYSYVKSGLNIVFKDSTNYSASCFISNRNYFDFGDNTKSKNTQPNDMVSHTYLLPGVYSVCLISEGYQSELIKEFDTVCKYIQIESKLFNQESALSIYPNPINNILTVVFPLNEIGLPQQMMVSDITGRIISNQQYVTDFRGEIQIDFMQYTRGIYFVFNHIANKSRKQFKVRKE